MKFKTGESNPDKRHSKNNLTKGAFGKCQCKGNINMRVLPRSRRNVPQSTKGQ